MQEQLAFAPKFTRLHMHAHLIYLVSRHPSTQGLSVAPEYERKQPGCEVLI